MKFNAYSGMTVSAWALVVLVLATELSGAFKALLTATFTHHWIGKTVIVTAAFFLSGYLVKNSKVGEEKTAWYSAIASLAVIFLFFVIDYIG